MAAVDVSQLDLHQLGKRRKAALAELEEIRQEVERRLPELRHVDAEMTWRQIADATAYTENRLQRMWAAREEPG